MALLTDRTLAASSAITASTLIHIVDVNDFSQNPTGSSYKSNLGQLSSFFSGTSANIYNSNGNLTGNRTVSQGSFDLDFTGDENSRFSTSYTSSTNPSDFGGINNNSYITNIYHNDDTNGFVFSSSLFPGNSSMNVSEISTGVSGGVSFNAFQSSLAHYDGITTTREVGADINGVSINIGGGSGYYFPNTDGFSGQVMTTDGSGIVSWQTPTTFTGNTSATCITDLHVSNIHSCSPLYINPLSEGDIYVGSANTLTVDLTNETIGIGTTTPTEKLHVSGNTIINGNLSVTGNAILSATTASTLNISSTPTTDTGTTANYLTRDGSTGEVKVKTIPGPTVYGLFAQTGNSTAISATTVEGLLIDGGVGTLLVPANGFSVGDSFRADFGGLLSAKNNDTIRIRIKTLSGVILADSSGQTMTTAVNDVFQLSVNFTIRKLGTATNAEIVALGVFHTTKQSNGQQSGFAFNTVNSTTFDTTVNNELVVTAQWSSNSPLNSIYSDIFILNKIY
jgi:hypothetical protein